MCNSIIGSEKDERETFINAVLNNFADDITDRVFGSIRDNDTLYAKYKQFDDQYTLNRELGKAVKDKFNLNDLHNPDGSICECNDPKCRLIESYTRHEIKDCNANK